MGSGEGEREEGRRGWRRGARRAQLGQQPLQQLELARAAPDVLGRVAARLIVLVLVEVQVRVVAHLAKLHLDVVEAAHLELTIRSDGREALPLDLPVHELLHGGELALEHVPAK